MDNLMPGMIQRAHGITTTNTRPPTLKPARAKAHHPYHGGTPRDYCKILTVQGGTKGTGKALVRAYYWHSPITSELRNYDGMLPLDVPRFRAAIVAMVSAHGYTVTYWPRELRP